jgi:O-antigen/teichoic acid export membrane protein
VVTLLVNGPFAMVWAWKQFDLAKREDGRQMYAKICTYLLYVSLLAGLGISLFAKDALAWFVPREYWGAGILVPFIVLGYVLNNVRSITTSGIFVQKVTHMLSYVAIFSAAVNLGLNFLLIPKYHVLGAAISTMLTNATIMLVCLAVGQRIYFVRYEYGRMILCLSVAVAAFAASTRVPQGSWVAFAVDLVLFCVFLVLGLRLLNAEERKMFGQLVREGVDFGRRVMVRARPAALANPMAPPKLGG